MYTSLILPNFQVKEFEDCFAIFNANSQQNGMLPNLRIAKETSKIQEIDIKDLQQAQPLNTVISSAILGIYVGKVQSYLVLCEKCEQVAQVFNLNYYRVQQVVFKPFKVHDKKHEDVETIRNLEKYLTESFYFCQFEIGSLTLQKQRFNFPPDECFIWNTQMRKNFYKFSSICAILLQGYIAQIQSILNGESCKYILISRRSHHMSGTRFHHRGIDESGHVANCVETECVLFNGNHCYSHVIYRGSVPAFWIQQNTTRSAKITRSLELCNPAFLKHMMKFKTSYDQVHCVNLMGESKSEKRLNSIFEQLLQANELQWVGYQRVDFHKEVKAAKKERKFENIDAFIYQLDSKIKDFGFLLMDVGQNCQVLRKQTGAFRINCVDCLDRTNNFTSRLCLRIFELALNKPAPMGGQSFLQCIDTYKGTEFMAQYKVIWADNGDEISQIYCGTKATTSEMTKQGKTTLKGFLLHQLASIERFGNQFMVDNHKNMVIQTLLNCGQVQQSMLEMFMSTQLASYCKMKKIKVFASTWNLGAKAIDNQDLLKDYLRFTKDDAPDIVLIGVQEIVKLNAKSMIIKAQDEMHRFDTTLELNLKKLDTYVKADSINLMGLYLVFYIKKDLYPQISKLRKEEFKLGFDGHIGNKGAVAIQFSIFDSLITVINCHLTAGDKNHAKRLQDLRDIHDNLFTSNGKLSSNVWSSDYLLLLGDMNFRMDAQREQVFQLIQKYQNAEASKRLRESEQNVLQLQEQDQGMQTKQFFPLSEYQEAGITFLPTYKYDVGTDRYDTSKKLRTPAYCDRIFLRPREPLVVRQYYYGRAERFESDHRPVTAIYQVEIKQVNREKEKALIEEFVMKSQMQKQETGEMAEGGVQGMQEVVEPEKKEQNVPQIKLVESYYQPPQQAQEGGEKGPEKQRSLLDWFKNK